MEVLRRCPLAIAQRLVHCAIALSTAVLDRVTKTMSVAPLLTNNLDNSKQKTSNLLSPAPPPYSWSLLGIVEGPAPPPSSKISRYFWSRLEPCSVADGLLAVFTGWSASAIYQSSVPPPPPLCPSPSTISRIVFVDVKHHLYFLTQTLWDTMVHNYRHQSVIQYRHGHSAQVNHDGHSRCLSRSMNRNFANNIRLYQNWALPT